LDLDLPEVFLNLNLWCRDVFTALVPFCLVIKVCRPTPCFQLTAFRKYQRLSHFCNNIPQHSEDVLYADVTISSDLTRHLTSNSGRSEGAHRFSKNPEVTSKF